MLEPDDRRSLLDALRPPSGFALAQAAGTSYSLDLRSVLLAPVAFALFSTEEGEEAVNRIAVLEAVRRHAERITVFCQAGAARLRGRFLPVVAWLEGSIYPCAARAEGHAFHPKVWVLRFARGGDVCHRVLCLSRNMTDDRSWDLLVRLDEVPGAEPNGGPLATFLRALPGLSCRPLPPERQEAVEDLAASVARAAFAPPPGARDVAFVPLGVGPAAGWPLPTGGERALVVSPFLSAGAIQQVRALAPQVHVVSRSESLDALGGRALAGLTSVRALRPELAADDEADREGPEPAPPSGLHAKLFVVDRGGDTLLVAGSANATTAAFGGNVEMLVALSGDPRRLGVDVLLGGQDGRSGLAELLEVFVPAAADPLPESVAEAIDRRLDAAAVRLGSAAWHAEAAAAATDAFALTLRTEEELPSLPGITASFRPVTRPIEDARPLAGADPIAFGPMPERDLTAFFAVHLEAGENGVTRRTDFVLVADLEGAPEGRLARLLAEQLATRRDVIRYLMFLLGDTSAGEDPVAIITESATATGEDDEHDALVGVPLLESLVRTLSRHPERLAAVGSLVETLASTEEGRERMPRGLEQVWEALKAACGRTP